MPLGRAMFANCGNLVERMVVTHAGDTIEEHELPAELLTAKETSRAVTLPSSLAEAVEKCEETISAALAECEFHREKTAKRLGISIRSLHYKMGRYGLH
ncbi:MAG: helix-turn-helix domain-containing protein [Pirellulaceae bacterium]